MFIMVGYRGGMIDVYVRSHIGLFYGIPVLFDDFVFDVDGFEAYCNDS